MIELILILETEDDRIHITCGSTDDLVDYLKTINLEDYERSNILFYIDDKVNYAISKIYKERYLKKN
jgi:hypothetical protein